MSAEGRCRRAVGLMKRLILPFAFFALLNLQFPSMWAQDSDFEIDPIRERTLSERMLQFIDDFNRIYNSNGMRFGRSVSDFESASHVKVVGEKIRVLNNSFQSLDFRWNAFMQSEQVEIAESESLMDLMTKVQQLKQAIGDSIASLQNKCDAVANFIEAEQFISSQDTIYKVLHKKAFGLSLSKRLGPQLEKVKTEEKAVFEKIETSYSKSRDAGQHIPQLKNRADKLDEQYYTLKSLSGKIQAMEYKPFVERAKDYLMGLACVSVILIFFNMVVTKIKAAKKTRDMLKKQKELLEKNNKGEYPTI